MTTALAQRHRRDGHSSLAADDVTPRLRRRRPSSGASTSTVAPGEILVVARPLRLRQVHPAAGRSPACCARSSGPQSSRTAPRSPPPRAGPRPGLPGRRAAAVAHRPVATSSSPLALRGISRGERRRRAAEWLERVGLAGYADRLPGELSGGMRQRVQLARGLAGAPAGRADGRAVRRARRPDPRRPCSALLVEALAARTRRTVVFVTHDVDEALLLGDRVVGARARGRRRCARRRRAARRATATPSTAPTPALPARTSWPRCAARAPTPTNTPESLMDIPPRRRPARARLRRARHRRRHRRHDGRDHRRRDTAPTCCCWRRRTCGTPARWPWAWTASTTPSSPARPTPEDYVAEITRANDGIVNQRTVCQTATRGFAMVQRLEKLRREVREGRVRRVRRAPGAPLRAATCCRCPRARTSRRCSTGCCGSARCARRSGSRTG